MSITSHRTTSLAAAIVLLGLVIRLLCSTGELWFDELWSVSMTRNLNSLFDALTIPHDNRHPLTSFWIQFFAVDGPAWRFRLQSLMWGVVTSITFLYLYTQKRNPIHLVWLLLYATSYLFVVYDSEARGYAGMVACSLLLYSVKGRIFASASLQHLFYFTLLALLGILSHALFILFLAPYVAWGWYLTFRGTANWQVTRHITFIALILLLGLEVPLYAQMEIGGAPFLPYVQVLGSTLLLSLGGDGISSFAAERAVWQLLGGCIFVIVVLIELALWFKEEKDEAVFISLVIGTPLLAVIVAQPHFVLPRYFLLTVLFLYLLYSRFLIRLIYRGALGKLVAGGLLLGFVVCNARHVIHLHSFGRSSFVKAITNIATMTPDAVIGGNHDFQTQVRLPLLISSYPLLKNITYIPEYQRANVNITYLLIENVDRDEISPQNLKTEVGASYSKESTWKAPPESGANLTIYKRID